MTVKAINKFIALLAGSKGSDVIPSGKLFEKWKTAAHKTNSAATPRYKDCIFENSAVPSPDNVPKIINATAKGPIVVPKEFTPPARFNLEEPDFESPRDTANGFAQVCCKEKPNPTINSAIRTP